MRHQCSGISKLLALWRKSYYQRAREINKGVENKYTCDWTHKNKDLDMDVKDRLGIPASRVFPSKSNFLSSSRFNRDLSKDISVIFIYPYLFNIDMF